MKKLVIPTILAATVLVAGMFAFAPVQKASTVHTSILAGIRDNTIVTGITIVGTGDRVVLVDNAGIGGVSDVEVTWRLGDADCAVQSFNGAIFTTLVDDGAFGGNPSHFDVANAESVVLTAPGAGDCTVNAAVGEFVTVSTVGT